MFVHCNFIAQKAGHQMNGSHVKVSLFFFICIKTKRFYLFIMLHGRKNTVEKYSAFINFIILIPRNKVGSTFFYRWKKKSFVQRELIRLRLFREAVHEFNP